jgi:hypothetical protein
MISVATISGSPPAPAPGTRSAPRRSPRRSRSRPPSAPPSRPRCRPCSPRSRPGFFGSSSGSLKTIFIRSDPMSAILVKIPPQMRSTDAPSDSPMAKPMKHGPTRSRGRNTRMQIMKNNSTHTSSNPTLMPERSGMPSVASGIALQRRERGARVRHRVDPNAEPGHAVGAEDAQDRRQQDHHHVERHVPRCRSPAHPRVLDRWKDSLHHPERRDLDLPADAQTSHPDRQTGITRRQRSAFCVPQKKPGPAARGWPSGPGE